MQMENSRVAFAYPVDPRLSAGKKKIQPSGTKQL